jgi:hypothetical protein
MALASWLSLLCPLLIGASYASWCVDRLPRTRIVFGIAGALCLLGAIWLHGDFFSSPSLPQPAAAAGH